MKTRHLTWLVAPMFVLGLAACDVEQTQEGDLPDVDVSAQGGEMPEYDVDTAEVEVQSEERQVTVPDVDVSSEERTVTTPDVDVQMPGEEQEQASEDAPAQPRG